MIFSRLRITLHYTTLHCTTRGYIRTRRVRFDQKRHLIWIHSAFFCPAFIALDSDSLRRCRCRCRCRRRCCCWCISIYTIYAYNDLKLYVHTTTTWAELHNCCTGHIRRLCAAAATPASLSLLINDAMYTSNSNVIYTGPTATRFRPARLHRRGYQVSEINER